MSKKITEWSRLSWFCGCGALNAGWLDNCGKCGKDKKENQKGIEQLEKLVEKMDEDDIEFKSQRTTRIRVKMNLLILLLYQTKRELEYSVCNRDAPAFQAVESRWYQYYKHFS
mgnify:CR=1 FL=1